MRQLRVAAGLTQTDLAGDRFSKEYVSQIERGKTRPTRETIEWLAVKLGVDPGFLERGVSADERRRVDTLLARARGAHRIPSVRRGDRRVRELQDRRRSRRCRPSSRSASSRARLGRGWRTARSSPAIELLNRARMLAEAPEFSDVDRADLFFRLGRLPLPAFQHRDRASTLLNEALTLAERSELPCDRLRADILGWRSRCCRRQRDFEAAREDVERALELAQALDDPRKTARHVLPGFSCQRADGALGPGAQLR